MSSVLAPILFFLFLSAHRIYAVEIPHDSEVSALLSFKHTCSSDTGSSLSSWNPETDPCNTTWRGVTCLHGHVDRVILEGLSLVCDVSPLTHLPYLSVLSLKNNSFMGPIVTLDLTTWQPHLKLLYLSHNQFTGPFPTAILSLRHLRRLDLAGNRLSGMIPVQIGYALPNLFTLRLENNLFSGEIPTSITNMTYLTGLNLSYNRLEGRIPSRLFSFPQSSFIGNRELCGDPIQRYCSNKTFTSDRTKISSRKRKNWLGIFVTALALAGLVATLALVIAVLICFRKKRKKGQHGEVHQGTEKTVRETEKGEVMVFFEGCEEFTMEELMRGSAEMLGRGVVGTTYRVVMERSGDRKGVVVKRVRRERRKEEEATERKVLGQMAEWQHPNVAGLRAYYSSADELLLAFDFQPNGSLYDILHRNRGPGRIPISWSTRLKLALDAAQGLTYLHSASKSNLSHQHLTSSNILVDSNYNALISDFSLLNLTTKPPLHSSQNTDVYNFGVILLEILTGKSTDDGTVDLPKWVQTVVQEEWTSEVFDVELWGCKDMEDEMVAMLQIALLCVSQEPKDRPKMSVVSKMIEEIRDRAIRSSRSRSRSSQSPSLTFESSPCLSDDTPTLTSS